MALHSEFFTTLSHHWWVFAARGVLAVLFGILALVWPALTLLALVLLWGAYAIVDGVLALVAAFRTRDRGRAVWALILIGIAGIIAGFLTFAWPAITGLVLLLLIAAWAIVVGILQIVTAVRLRKEIDNEWLLGVSGVLSVAFGALLIWSPGAGAVALAWAIGWYAILFGVLLIALGFKLRRQRTAAPTASSY
jgi:uncharacterized membrane protein HdeD (DUF308 family)